MAKRPLLGHDLHKKRPSSAYSLNRKLIGCIQTTFFRSLLGVRTFRTRPQPVAAGQRPSESRRAFHITRVWLQSWSVFFRYWDMAYVLAKFHIRSVPRENAASVGPCHARPMVTLPVLTETGPQPRGAAASTRIPSEPGSPKASRVPVTHPTYCHPSSAKDRCRLSPKTT